MDKVSIEGMQSKNSLFIANSYSLAMFMRNGYEEQNSGETDPVYFSVFSWNVYQQKPG